jgi:tyrosine-protein kinase Etk/Wzc
VEDSVRAIDLIRIVFRWRKPAAVFVCGVVLAALIYCLVTPNEYTAVATLMPGSTPGEASPMQNMAGSFLNQFGFGGMFRGAATNPADVFANTLRSRFVARNVVNELGLVELFDVKEKNPFRALEKATKDLRDITTVDVSDMLLISVGVTYQDPVMAAKIANVFIDELEKANQQFSLSSAKNAREFVELRLASTEESLHDAQTKFTEFQQEHGAVALDEQSRVTVEAVARLEGEILAMEAKRDALSATHTPSYSILRELDLTIDALRKKVRGLTMAGGGDEENPDGGEGVLSEMGVFIPLGDVPAMAAEYARLLLDVKTQASVLEILVQQHEQLKIEEAKDVPTIQILDRAVAPIEKSKPYRTVIMIVAIFVGLVGSFVLALTLNYLESEFDAGQRAELNSMRKNVVQEVLSRIPGRGARPPRVDDGPPGD